MMTEQEIDLIAKLTGRGKNGSKAFLAAKEHLLTGNRKSDLARKYSISRATVQNCVKGITDDYAEIQRVFVTPKIIQKQDTHYDQ